MIGVDIIDLSCSFSQSKYTFDDYAKRILHHSEKQFCENITQLECIWAIKESAYKCYFKETGRHFLNPKKILVTRIDMGSCRFQVRINDIFYLGYFCLTDRYLYAICSNLLDVRTHQVYLHTGDTLTESQDEFSWYFSAPVSQITYRLHKEEGFLCLVEFNGYQYPYSRSHHGRYYISAIIAQ